jgi:DMSO/TMAO reductase YedYZ molybdopterin-dependent catalytic subunit
MPLEALRYDVTPLGMHYLLIHFDIPATDDGSWTVSVDGSVRRELTLTMADLRARPAFTRSVTMECAGNGRALMEPRPVSQPWLQEAVGTASWTGTPLSPILDEAGLLGDAVELVFTGADHGIQGDVEHDYQRSLSVTDAMRPEVLLAYAVNGQPLTPQHGAPVRLLVPGWYGMTSVKWLTRITAVADPFDGFQMQAYVLKADDDDPGVRITRMQPRALMVPPGFPDFLTRVRTVDAGRVDLQGRAWSGWGPIERVEVSVDGGVTWSAASLGASLGDDAWRRWDFGWDAAPGQHVLECRATDAQGNTQPSTPDWNVGGFRNNATQRVPVTVRGTDN